MKPPIPFIHIITGTNIRSPEHCRAQLPYLSCIWFKKVLYYNTEVGVVGKVGGVRIHIEIKIIIDNSDFENFRTKFLLKMGII